MSAPVEDLDRIMAVMTTAFPPDYGEAWTRRQVEDSLLTGNCHYILINPQGHTPPADGQPAADMAVKGHAAVPQILLFWGFQYY